MVTQRGLDYIAKLLLGMGMNLVTTNDKTQEIKKELAELNQSLKMTVRKAIYVGQLLIEQKEYVGHGNWLPWLERNVDLSERTAQKYMNLYAYRDKTAKIADLQTAFIEGIQDFKALGWMIWPDH